MDAAQPGEAIEAIAITPVSLSVTGNTKQSLPVTTLHTSPPACTRSASAYHRQPAARSMQSDGTRAELELMHSQDQATP